MIIDAADLQSGQVIRADVAVIGSGPAGLTVGRRAAEAGLDVAILESGRKAFDRSIQALNQSENRSELAINPETARIRQLGGSTTVWSGRCLAFDRLDFERRADLPYSGWPFGIEELEGSYEVARHTLGLRVTGAALREREADLRSSSADWRGGDLDVRWFDRQWRSIADLHREFLDRHARVRLFVDATVARLALRAGTDQIEELHCTTQSHRPFSVEAAAYVLAAGGIENARLLLLSNRERPAGIGNESDLVGRFFADHPYVDAGHVDDGTLSPDFTGAETPSDEPQQHGLLILSEQARRRTGSPGAAAYLKDFPAYMTSDHHHGAGLQAVRQIQTARRYGQPLRLASHVPHVVRGLPHVAAHAAGRAMHRVRPRMTRVVRTVIEPVPNPDNRVTLSTERDRLGLPRARVEWRLTEADRETYRAFNDTFGAAVARSGPGKFHPSAAVERLWPDPINEGKHHMGTTRMHADPRRGVVNSDCRVHGVGNLFVAGSSVFPTYGYANPTLTIVALAARLADHLQEVVRGRQPPPSRS